jgi:hypothetical protein
MNKVEQSIKQGKYNKVKTFLKQLFCIHQYEIGIIVGLGFKPIHSNIAVAKDGAEIVCFCSKCHKQFVKVFSTSDGKITKE